MSRILQPEGWKRPKGYANGMAASGRLVVTAGIVGWNEQERFESHTLTGQFRQVLHNTLAILAEAGAGPEHIVRMSWYITDREEYLREQKALGAIWKEVIGPYYPAMACVQVIALIEEMAKIEIETIAVVPQ